jgi:hypothetical protein
VWIRESGIPIPAKTCGGDAELGFFKKIRGKNSTGTREQGNKGIGTGS